MPILNVNKISKAFPGVQALADVDLNLIKGECHALLGENGAGKSTLIKILAGIYQPDSGEISINGKLEDIQDVNGSQKLGISVIHQELVLVPHMTIAENIFLGKEPVKKVFIDMKSMISRFQEILDRFDLGLTAGQKVSKLSIAQQQMVEIAKALSTDSEIIIMDEPTASLTQKETEQLFDLIRELKSQDIAILFVSHRMEEIFAITDRITVLRDGLYIGTKGTKDTSRSELISMMVGRELDEYFISERHVGVKPVLEIRGLSRDGVLNNISFNVMEGEILGIYGIVGAGRTELARAIFGIDRIDGGEVVLDGKVLSVKSPKDAIRFGITLIPENRKEQGLILQEEVGFNLTLQVLKEFISFVFIKRRMERSIIRTAFENLSIKAYSARQKVKQLSGGNQQKIVIAKWLATTPRVLILDEPTRGIDVGAKAEIYSLMNDLAKTGVSIIMITSELLEAMNISDRLLVMYHGTITGQFNKENATQERIMHSATGGSDELYTPTPA